ncbi:MAG: hypothetical protein HY644_02495 [Acidobacteria bacterium]|nr:hypothetical protein [Acidobacteriota bacterium]
MRILKVEKTAEPHVVRITAVLGETEFEQLAGNLDHLCIFSTKTICEPSRATRTGARHSWAGWLLFPKCLQRQFKTENFDFERIKCGVVKYLDKLYIVHEVSRKSFGSLPADNQK